MEHNPFEPPSELADVARGEAPAGESRGTKVYIPNHVALAAFLGTPLAGAWLIAANYTALGRSGDRTRTLVVGFVATLVLFGFASLLPDGFPGTFLGIAYAIALRELTRHLQGKPIDHVLASGGTKHSGWRAAGVGVVFLVIALAVLGAVVVLSGDALPSD